MIRVGFTLIELIILMGILLSLFALTTGASFSTITQTQSGTLQSTIIADLRATQSKAMLGASTNTPLDGWGIFFESDHYIIFPGTVYDPGSASNTRVEIPANTSISATPQTIVFLSKSGYLSSPSPEPIITLTAGATTQTIIINPWGVPHATP